MRRTLAVGVLLVVGAVLAAPAFAAPSTPTEKKLQAEITVLQNKIPAMQKQVTTLQKQVKTLTNVLSAEIDYSICSNAVTADALQQTWATVNISSTGAIFGAAESPVNDIGSCTSWKVTRAAAGVPNLAIFKALIALWS